MTYKMVFVVRTDLDMGKGKIAAQVAHAAVALDRTCPMEYLAKWDFSGQAKVALKSSGEESLRLLCKRAFEAGLPFHLVRDAGRTQIEAGSITVLGIGPADGDRIDAITGGLKLL